MTFLSLRIQHVAGNNIRGAVFGFQSDEEKIIYSHTHNRTHTHLWMEVYIIDFLERFARAGNLLSRLIFWGMRICLLLQHIHDFINIKFNPQSLDKATSKNRRITHYIYLLSIQLASSIFTGMADSNGPSVSELAAAGGGNGRGIDDTFQSSSSALSGGVGETAEEAVWLEAASGLHRSASVGSPLAGPGRRCNGSLQRRERPPSFSAVDKG